MALHNELGKKGETYACEYLKSKGFKILKTNWRFHRNEIDIIAENKDCILFVEVKTRSSYDWGLPEDFLSRAQTRRLQDAVNFYIQDKDIEKEPRIDVLALVEIEGEYQIEHFEDVIIPSL